MRDLLSIGQAARRLGLSVDTVRELENSGELAAVRTPGGHRRFKPAVLDAFQGQRSNPRPRRRAPPTVPSEPPTRRKRTRPIDDEPPEERPPDDWDEEPFESNVTAPVPRSAHEQRMEQITQSNERMAEQSRLANLRSYGQSLIPWGASASARSTVFEAMDSYVTASRFPPSMPVWEAHQAIDAKVAAIMEPFNAEAARDAARKQAADAKRLEHEREEQRVRSLIEHGKSRAMRHTISWDWEDKREARADVEEALQDKVEADWSERDVDELVDDELDEWELDTDE